MIQEQWLLMRPIGRTPGGALVYRDAACVSSIEAARAAYDLLGTPLKVYFRSRLTDSFISLVEVHTEE